MRDVLITHRWYELGTVSKKFLRRDNRWYYNNFKIVCYNIDYFLLEHLEPFSLYQDNKSLIADYIPHKIKTMHKY